MNANRNLVVSMGMRDYFQFKAGVVTWSNLDLWALQWRKFRKAVLKAAALGPGTSLLIH